MDAVQRMRPAVRVGERVSLRLHGPAGDLIGFVVALDPLTLEDRHGRLHEVPDGAVAAARRVGVPLGRDPARASRELLDELAGRAGIAGEPEVRRISDVVAGRVPPQAVFAARVVWRDRAWVARVEGEWLTTNVTDPELLVALAWWAGRQNARSVQIRPEPGP